MLFRSGCGEYSSDLEKFLEEADFINTGNIFTQWIFYPGTIEGFLNGEEEYDLTPALKEDLKSFIEDLKEADASFLMFSSLY